MAVYPEVQLADYKARMDVSKRKKVEVDDKELNEAIFAICRSKSKESVVPRPAQKGDFKKLILRSDWPALRLKAANREIIRLCSVKENLSRFEDGIMV